MELSHSCWRQVSLCHLCTLLAWTKTLTQLVLFSRIEAIATTSRPVVFRSSVFAAVRLLNTSSTEIKNGISTKLSENRPRRALFYGMLLCVGGSLTRRRYV